MSFRKEFKYRISISDQILLKQKLLLKGMFLLFPKRKVQSCYFDNSSRSMYFDSLEGILPRKKIRLRWYNSINKISKETKISSFEGRFKTQTFFYKNNFLKNFDHQFIDNYYGKITPIILISYQREYFQYKNLRITFDNNIHYKNLRGFNKNCKDEECVIEIKTDSSLSNDFVEKIMGMNVNGFSKYCRGISLVNIS